VRHNDYHPPITRRTAVGQMLSAAAGIAGAAKFGAAGETASRGSAVRVERQPTGSEIWQITTEEFSQSNIYCEVPWCSADSRYFVYQRTTPKLSGNRTELMIVELGTWKQHLLDVACGITGIAITPEGVLYYRKRAAGNSFDLMRADLSKGVPKKVYRRPDGSRDRSLGTVSFDGRYYATGTRPGDGYDTFAILLVDFQQGTETIIDRDPSICNSHPQFDPASNQLMIQHNRGCEFSPDGKLIRLVGPEGATLYLLSVPDGKRTELQVGKPYTTPCTGHEAWIGKTGEMLLSVSASGDYAPEKGNLLGVQAGQPARIVTKGYRFNHVGVSHCGRFFCCDDWRPPYKLVIGSTKTGASAVVCESKTSPTRGQNTHPHAYLTPDLKWVIFNSNCSGFPHLYAASVPDGMIKELSAG